VLMQPNAQFRICVRVFGCVEEGLGYELSREGCGKGRERPGTVGKGVNVA